MKLSLDIVLLFLFGLLCNTGATGTAFHEILGLIYAALIIAHLALNYRWLAAAFKGKLHGRRSAAMSSINIALAADLLIILITGLRASHFLFPAAIKAPSYILVTHAVGGTIAAILVLAHVLLHARTITKGIAFRKVILTVVLTVVVGYSLYGSVHGALHHGLPKNSEQKNGQRDNGNGDHQPKDGERKQ